jgi:hypothetical protein
MRSKTEPVGVPTASANHQHIFGQKRVMPDDCRRVGQRIEQGAAGLEVKEVVEVS